MNRLTSTLKLVANPMFARSISTSLPDQYFLLFYKYVPGILEKRGPYRAAHLANAKKYHDKGKCLMVGAYANPPDGACFAFKCKSKEEIQEFITSDPYYQNGLVVDYNIRDWCVVPLDN